MELKLIVSLVIIAVVVGITLYRRNTKKPSRGSFGGRSQNPTTKKLN